MKTNIQHSIIAAGLALSMSLSGSAYATETTGTDLQPLQAHTLDMSDYTAVVYYSILDSGEYQVVTTIGPNLDTVGKVSQHRVSLKPGQSYELSFDTGVVGTPATAISFKADSHTLIVASR